MARKSLVWKSVVVLVAADDIGFVVVGAAVDMDIVAAAWIEQVALKHWTEIVALIRNE